VTVVRACRACRLEPVNADGECRAHAFFRLYRRQHTRARPDTPRDARIGRRRTRHRTTQTP
jgi:hypothetical protein